MDTVQEGTLATCTKTLGIFADLLTLLLKIKQYIDD